MGFALFVATGCNHIQRAPSPEQTYAQVEKRFLSGDLAGSQSKAQAALRQYETSEPVWGARFRVELAKIRLYQGQCPDVVALLDQPLPNGSPKELLIKRYLLLTVAQDRLGKNAPSDESMRRAAVLQPQGVLHAEMIRTQGSVALDRGDLDAAGRLFLQALDEARVANDRFLQTQVSMNLGVVAMQQEHYQDALHRFDQASVIARSIGDQLHLEKALGNLGWISYQTGDFPKALQYLQSSETLARSLGADQDEAQIATNLGTIQFETGNSLKSRASYQRALALAEKLHNADMISDAHVALAYLLLGTDRPAAEDHIQEAAADARLMKNRLKEQEVSFLSALLLREEGKTTEASSALTSLERRTGNWPWLRWRTENTLATLYAASGKDASARLWFERAIRTFHRQRDSVEDVGMQLPFFENGSDLYLSYMEYLIGQHRTEEGLMVLDRSRAELLAEGLHREAGGQRVSVSPQKLAAQLGGTILVYCLRPQHSYLWVIDEKRDEFQELPGKEVILPLVERHTQAILASKDLLAQKDSTGLTLYKELVLPAEAMVKPGGRVFLIPDQGLSGLNFETLVVKGTHPHYWIEDVTVTNARSLRLLAARRSGSDSDGAERKMLLIGDPVYRAEEYAPLPNASAEMMRVASHFTPQQRTVFAKAAASPAAYTGTEAGRYGYIHFVAHATADAMNPLDSAVILSNATKGASPYKLYAADILKQPLNAELVTISSCYGSGVRNYAGEGVVGLVWAFLRAGAHSVIGALWEVSDISTPQLMDAMYGELLRGSPPDAALRSAKLAMLRDKGVFRKPLYWAAFQLYAGR